MAHFLVVYDRSKGKLLDVREFGDDDFAGALSARFARERAEQGDEDIEVVVLSGSSRETIERTQTMMA